MSWSVGALLTLGKGRHNSQSSNKKRGRKGRLREDWLGSELGREIKKGGIGDERGGRNKTKEGLGIRELVD